MLESVDLSGYEFAPLCEVEGCERRAGYICQGCSDKEPQIRCEECMNKQLSLLDRYIKLVQKITKKVMICGDCYRPILTLDTHLTVKKL